ncbi:MAG: class I SAM-dependent methyltransferase [Lachnospiraceae bacterium]|nr:class I SAM-dependent methyltransferase [Lachnospiraceae bacterium]
MQLGTYYTNMIRSDVKHLTFTLSRYKFASKLLMYKEEVELLELGCQEALGALMFQQNMNLKTYTGIDFDKRAIEWNRDNLFPNMEFICADFFNCAELENRKFDAVVSLDVIEHIRLDMEDQYCEVICGKLNGGGTAIVGTPSIMLSPYACEASKIGHINLYDQKRLYGLMSKYFHNVFIFNMNDEIVHTGFAPMSCYIFAVCCNQK